MGTAERDAREDRSSNDEYCPLVSLVMGRGQSGSPSANCTITY